MRSAPLLASLSLFLAAASAGATVTQPNGVVMPVDSMNGETQLYTMFSNLGEPVDWKLDGNTQPGAFSPLCDFTATLVLRQTGSSLAVGWYNATGMKPTAAEIHVIVPVGAQVGAVFASSDIKNDPAYLGGEIGFALVGGQTHYSELAWNPVCTGCNPPAPWVSAVIYASKNTPNAFYIAFEDGTMGANPNAFGNDGDYNDYVYFLSGLTCSGGGQPCDTGLPGICGPGVTQCSGSGVVCQQLNQPKPVETCNGLDDDCNGASDEGDLCESGFVCDKGTCVQSCNDGEFTCPPDRVCNAVGFCVEPPCKEVICDAGDVCVGGVCKGPCDGVICPEPQVCRVGACVDPCAGLTCGNGQVCDGGVCVLACSCAPCAASEECDAPSGICVEPACVGVVCAVGTHCEGGQCVDSCQGAVCPAGQECKTGECVPVPMMGTGGSTGAFGFGGGGAGGAGASGTGGAPGTGGKPQTSSSGTGGAPGSTGGCGCEVPGAGERERGAGAIAGLALGFASAWARARARARRRGEDQGR